MTDLECELCARKTCNIKKTSEQNKNQKNKNRAVSPTSHCGLALPGDNCSSDPLPTSPLSGQNWAGLGFLLQG